MRYVENQEHGSIDRLVQVPERLRFLFDYSAERSLTDPAIEAEASDPAVRSVIAALAEEIAQSGPLTHKET